MDQSLLGTPFNEKEIFCFVFFLLFNKLKKFIKSTRRMANGIFCSKAGVGTDRNDVLSEL